jgi:hypothetical protein
MNGARDHAARDRRRHRNCDGDDEHGVQRGREMLGGSRGNDDERSHKKHAEVAKPKRNGDGERGEIEHTQAGRIDARRARHIARHKRDHQPVALAEEERSHTDRSTDGDIVSQPVGVPGFPNRASMRLSPGVNSAPTASAAEKTTPITVSVAIRVFLRRFRSAACRGAA